MASHGKAGDKNVGRVGTVLLPDPGIKFANEKGLPPVSRRVRLVDIPGVFQAVGQHEDKTVPVGITLRVKHFGK